MHGMDYSTFWDSDKDDKSGCNIVELRSVINKFPK